MRDPNPFPKIRLFPSPERFALQVVAAYTMSFVITTSLLQGDFNLFLIGTIGLAMTAIAELAQRRRNVRSVR